MEVIIAVQLCALGLMLYLLNANNNQIWRLKNQQRNKDDEIRELLYSLEQSKNENAKLSAQLQNNKKLFLKPVVDKKQTTSKKDIEISGLKRELQAKDNEIRQLQYTLNTNNFNTSRFSQQLSEKDVVIRNLQYQLDEKEKEIYRLKSAPPRVREIFVNQPPPPTEKRFVQVIFQKGDKKRYDYFLGNHNDVKVGDFVEVYARNKFSRKNEWKVVKVVRVSDFGEVSSNATSEIIRKADYPKWN